MLQTLLTDNNNRFCVLLSRHATQYKVTNAEAAEKFFYNLTEPRQQMTALIFDVIRSLAPKMPLDDVFTSKTELSEAVQAQLKEAFESFGLSIISTPITDIDPSQGVKDAMKYGRCCPQCRATLHRIPQKRVYS
jgi:regulator of protease activity HflC (stomatin/prohibitin superfamily)